jgi:SAM-dependent methyltransferase
VCAGPFGAVYDLYIERDWLMRLIGRVVWGIDASVLYTSMEAISRAGNGARIIDVPCGGGVALRALRPDQDVRYIAMDASEKMLERAERRAKRRSLGQVEFAVADMRALPLADGEADLVVCYSGLHMLEHPEPAVKELARCLKPGGELVGTTFLAEGSRRQQALFELERRRGNPAPPRREDLLDWLQKSGIAEAVIQPERGFGVFRGRKPTSEAEIGELQAARSSDALYTPGLSLVDLVEAVRALPYGRPSDRTVEGMLREHRGTCSTKHLLLAQALAERFPETDPLIVHRVYTLDRAQARELFDDTVAEVVPEDGLVDVHRYLTITLEGQHVEIDATFPGPAWDGRSSLPLACGSGRDYPGGEDPDAEKRALEAQHCDPTIREPFIAALASIERL